MVERETLSKFTIHFRIGIGLWFGGLSGYHAIWMEGWGIWIII